MKKIPRADFHRKNGLSWPWQPLQVFAWILTALICCAFFGFQFPILSRSISIFWSCIFSFCYVAGIFLFVIATLSENPLPPIISQDQSNFCKYCNERVISTAKHCRECNKCRDGFDHHCKYINNCVTKSNYKSFFYGCLFLESSDIVAVSHLFFSLHEFLKNKSDVLNRLSIFYKLNTTEITFWVLFGISLVIYLGFLIPVMVLIGYHAYFQKRSITTYDYILKNFSKAPQNIQSFCCTGCRNVRVSSF